MSHINFKCDCGADGWTEIDDEMIVEERCPFCSRLNKVYPNGKVGNVSKS